MIVQFLFFFLFIFFLLAGVWGDSHNGVPHPLPRSHHQIHGDEHLIPKPEPLSPLPGKLLEYHSFQPPFKEIDNSGQRMVSRHWRDSGATKINSNFIRLTPDRQSKKGALWSRKPLGVSSFSTILKFRISGQGKTFFGDGIGFWIVHQGYYTEGDLHGFQERFVGVGIIFDTFKNTENLAAHRDVTVLVNDGEKTWEMMTAEVKGCNTNVRYHNERADFHVQNSASKAKIILTEDNTLTVTIDAKNSGEWQDCVVIKDLPLPLNWAENAYMGLTATTGQLADNHDIISLATYSDHSALEVHEAANAEKKEFKIDPRLSVDEKLRVMEEAIEKLTAKINFLDHHFEHELETVEDGIKTMNKKIESRETKSENRLDNLELVVKKEVEGSISDRLASLEHVMKGNLDRKLNNLESKYDQKITTIESTSKKTSGGGFQILFFLALILLGCSFVGLYFFYKQHVKFSKLP